ncbi:MAG: hypothetical protein A4E55_01509 [Pelotomaculum sp. PtaU1.Bin035]|nr:MAG: hypothetical protein A4E55_01509 [Pelotomaculum sp. PtaU1.Bin035]
MTYFKKKLLLVLTAALFITTFALTSVYASSNMKTVQAYQGVRIFYNDEELTGDNQPYIINDSTYVPIRMIMDSFGKSIYWDSVNYRVVITDEAGTTEANLKAQLAQRDAQITTLQNKNAELQSTITSLNKKISDLDEDDISTSDIKETLIDYFEDAGDDYFDDDGIDVTISLSGDEDDLAYTIKLDFSDADDYANLTKVSTTKIKTFLNAVKSRINNKIDDTNYEDADITGKLIDKDNSSYYVKYNGSSYSFSWDEDDDTSINDIKETLIDYFEDAGDDYFDDDGIDVTISLSGDEDDLAYTIKLDFSDADDYANLTKVSTTKIKTFLNAVKSKINTEIDDTSYEDADITGKLIDNDNSSYYVKYDGSSYTFSWSS